MNAINEKLAALHAQGKSVKAALIGLGQMGTDIVATAANMKGFDVIVVVDITREKIVESLSAAHYKNGIEFVDGVKAASTAALNKKIAATTDWKVAVTMPEVEVVIDATGSPELGAVITLECIEQRKHIVMMNVECDITVGPILCKKAQDRGVIYTMAAGDEPAAIMELYRFADALGFEVVAAGKGKNNPLDITATPDSLAEKAAARNMSATMLCEFVDGSKTAIEMAAVSNATGLIPDIRGMHGAHSTVANLQNVFCPKIDGGVLSAKGVVDFAIGVHPGVFLIVTTDSPRLRESLVQRDMGPGPYYCFFRPFHLCSIEVPLTAAQTVIYGESAGHPRKNLVSECITVSKQNLKAGFILDGIGGFNYRVSIDTFENAKKENFLPAGLAKGATLKKNVSVGDVLTWDMVELNQNSMLFSLRKEMLGQGF